MNMNKCARERIEKSKGHFFRLTSYNHSLAVPGFDSRSDEARWLIYNFQRDNTKSCRHEYLWVKMAWWQACTPRPIATGSPSTSGQPVWSLLCWLGLLGMLLMSSSLSYLVNPNLLLSYALAFLNMLTDDIYSQLSHSQAWRPRRRGSYTYNLFYPLPIHDHLFLSISLRYSIRSSIRAPRPYCVRRSKSIQREK